MEAFAWFVCFVAWAVWKCREEKQEMDNKYSAKGDKQLTWYIIFRVWYMNEVKQLEELDAIQCECQMDALRYAKQRYRVGYGQSLLAEACLTMKHIERAKQLHNQHALDDQVSNWTDADWKEFCELPVYAGDQDKYLRTWTS